MNKEQLIATIQHPEQSASNDHTTFEELSRAFPYFQTVHLLLLYNLKKNENNQYDQQLRTSAMYVASRRVLFNLIHRLGTIDDKKAVLQKDPPPAENKELIITLATSESGQTNQSLTPDHTKNSQEDIQTALLELDENIQQENNDNENARVIEFSLDSDIQVVSVESKDTEFELEEENQNTREAPEQTFSFDLIEKFIEENPAFTPNRLTLSDEHEDISANSLKENEDLATETLALIYIGQQLYEKAITIYEKLILKFPEKSAYFAGRIKELRENIK